MKAKLIGTRRRGLEIILRVQFLSNAGVLLMTDTITMQYELYSSLADANQLRAYIIAHGQKLNQAITKLGNFGAVINEELDVP